MPGQTVAEVSVYRMEGRWLQWRAGQLPGQTWSPRRASRRPMPCFNGGPGNCPAKLDLSPHRDGMADPASMEGRAIARPNPVNPLGRLPTDPLQWRAGQLPGQTLLRAADQPPPRSLQWRAGQLPGQTESLSKSAEPFIGLQWRAGQLPGQNAEEYAKSVAVVLASMEGRAIARPNLQRFFDSPTSSYASMEGRAIARPNVSTRRPGRRRCRFNGGPGNCPAKPMHSSPVWWIARMLQWRAGQLPGQTTVIAAIKALRKVASMEGRAIARPNWAAVPVGRVGAVASMEGRAIARPNPITKLG